MPNSCANHQTTIFTPNHRHICGICISGNSVGHIQRTITILISIEKIQNLGSYSSFECVHSKTPSKNSLSFKSYCRNGDRRSLFNTFSKRLLLVNNLPLTYFLPKILFQDYWTHDIGKIFPGQNRVRIVRLLFLRPSIGR